MEYGHIRSHERRKTSHYAMLLIGEAEHPCTVLNISLGGAKLASSVFFEKGEKLQVDFGPAGKLRAQICWCNGGEAGVQFLAQERYIEPVILALAGAV